MDSLSSAKTNSTPRDPYSSRIHNICKFLGVGATLFCLIFVVISIKPEVARTETASVIRQVQVATSYSALLNPLVISLLALLPRATIETITVIMSTIGFVNTLVIGSFLLRDSTERMKNWKSTLFLLVGLVMFGFDYVYGVARAWDLVGVRQFHLQEVLSPLMSKGRDESASDT